MGRPSVTMDERIEQLDLSLFGHVASQTSVEDRRSLLAIQTAIRRSFPGYLYLEIGSHKGGSIQPHVVDPRCARIISIDPRPASQPDTRAVRYYYPENSTQSMLDSLGKIPGADVSKIKTFDATTSQLNEKMIGLRPQLCFVDGEHTHEAALRDARFCLSVLAENGAIAFHDAQLIYRGLQTFLAELTARGRVFRAHVLPDFVFLIEFGTIHFSETDPLRGRVRDSYRAYLAGMLANDMFVQAYPLSIARMAKAVRAWHDSAIRPVMRKVERLFKPKAFK